MKNHIIIPIFIPHKGCPHDCVFCNQKRITARQKPFEAVEIRQRMEEYLPTIEGRGIETVEAAFFGGSFTGIPIAEQQEYLTVLQEYKQTGRIHKIRLSTRPDYIDEPILENLKRFGVDIIELGIQSTDPVVLALSERGHSREAAFHACRMVGEWGFQLGVQLMIGLPGDTFAKSVRSAAEMAALKPAMARLYPTVMLEDTKLMEMYRDGAFSPLTHDEMLETTKEMYRIFQAKNIPVIRVGLKSSDLIQGGAGKASAYHPAFRQLVESRLLREKMEAKLTALGVAADADNVLDQGSADAFHLLEAEKTAASGQKGAGRGSKQRMGNQPETVTFYSRGESFSAMVGNGGENRLYFEQRYPSVRFRFKVSLKLDKGEIDAITDKKGDAEW